MAKVGVLLLFLALCPHFNNAAKILALLPVHGRSHYIFASSLPKELALRGHEVTVVSPFQQKEKIPNFNEIVLNKVYDMYKSMSNSDHLQRFEMKETYKMQLMFRLWGMGKSICELGLDEPEVQKLIHSKDQHFDAIIIEAFFNECFIGFAHKFNAPVIQVCAFNGAEWMGDWLGNPNPYSYIPDALLDYTDHMTFSERLSNTINGIATKVGIKLYYNPLQDEIIRKYFNYTDNMPSISELEKYNALLLLNTHFSISYPRPMVPNVVQVGGIHVKPPKKLPKDLQTFLDEAKDGVIYFSMGSNLRSSDMHEEKVQAFLQTFSKLKQKVLWKWETDTLPGQPANVKLGTWLPQSDILAHPNVKLFITHGGLLGTLETIIRGVPVVGIPIYGDQRTNMKKVEKAGFGVILEYKDITPETVLSTITKVLDTPKYDENVKHLSRIFRDQPLSPMDQAVFWTEYIIRHKGARHMRSAALDLTWYQYYLLDVIAVLTLAMIFVLFIVCKAVKYSFRIICGKKESQTKVGQSQKKYN